MLRIGLLLVLIFAIQISRGQECFNFHSIACKPAPSKYSYAVNSSSVSYKFDPGESRLIPFTLMAGKDYRITICSNQFNNAVHFRIVRLDQKVVYDNATLKYAFALEFSSMKTQDVILELVAPKIPENSTDSLANEGCIGLLIEEMVSIKTGF